MRYLINVHVPIVVLCVHDPPVVLCVPDPPVGADPCVHPTTVGHTESAKEVEAKDGMARKKQIQNQRKYVVPTLGGHTGPPLQADHVRRVR